MNRPAVVTATARDDLLSELHWIGPDNIARAWALRDAVLVAAQRLGNQPRLGRSQPDLLPEPYRSWSLPRFQVVLVYNAGTSSPRVLRLLSTSRDLGPLLAGIGPHEQEPGPV